MLHRLSLRSPHLIAAPHLRLKACNSRSVQLTNRALGLFCAFCALVVVGSALPSRAQPNPSSKTPEKSGISTNLDSKLAAQRALDSAIRATGAVALVLDLTSGQTIATAHAIQVDSLRATPGSTLKPFFLSTALHAGTATPRTEVFCRRTLHIAGHSLDCSHPQANVTFDAHDALVYSCNTWFAALARRLSSDDIANTLKTYGLALPSATPPGVNPMDAKQLLVLGVAGIAVSPRQLASAYRQLALDWQAAPPDTPVSLVHQALRDSVAYGMAHNAAVRGLDLAGKTGTATDPNHAWTHGWFCGTASGVVLAVYVPRGNGADAASLASAFFAAYGSASR